MVKKKKQQAGSKWRLITKEGFKWFLAPLLLYVALFFIFQPQYLGNFSDGFYLDNGDGFQNVWNIWWVNESVGEGSVNNPYYTTMVHWPHGTSLFPQTMNIFNGFMGIPLINLFGFSLIEAVNFAVVFSFVISGLTMFWFIYKLHRSYVAAIIGGALFTFSSYHFAHAQGHLQLVSMEFIPLFLLAFWTLLEKMRYRYALLAAGALFLVLLCDYYYLFWCVMIGAMLILWKYWKKELVINKRTLTVLTAFAASSLVLIGPLIFKLLSLNKKDPLLGSHNATQFGLDPVSVILPGGSWYWHSLTDWYSGRLEYFAEMSNFFGYALITVVVLMFVRTFVKKQTEGLPNWLNFWWIVLFVFGILSLGPHPSILGKTLYAVPLPYWFLEKVFPTLQISGMPVRWVLVSLIAAIVLVTYYLSKLDLNVKKAKYILVAFITVSLFDLWPRQLPLTPPQTRPYVATLQQLEYGSVIDNGALSGAEQLYHQTVHNKPIAFGYVTRLPQSVDTKDFHIFADLEEGRVDNLCNVHKIRYYTTPDHRPLKYGSYPVIYDDDDTLIYDLKNGDNC